MSWQQIDIIIPKKTRLIPIFYFTRVYGSWKTFISEKSKILLLTNFIKINNCKQQKSNPLSILKPFEKIFTSNKAARRA